MKKIQFKLPKFKKKSNKSELQSDGRSLRFPIFNLNKFLGALSYIYILVLIPVIFSKRNAFVKYHARQGFALLLVWTIGIFSFYVPGLAWLFALFILVEMVYGIVNVCMGKEKPLFWIGKWAIKSEEAISFDFTKKEKEEKDTNWTVTLILSILFGFLGVDRFIMRDFTFGLLKLVLGVSSVAWEAINLGNTIAGNAKFSIGAATLFVLFLCWWIVDIIRIASKSKFDGVKWI